jgi:hypothetical protein
MFLHQIISSPLNSGEVGPGVTAGQAGIEIDRGSAENYWFVFDETTDTFRVGEYTTTQAVATREDSPIDTRIPYWNDLAKRFDTAGDTYFVMDQTAETVIAAVDSEIQLQINSDGITLKDGASVNEILDSADALDSSTTDDQLATARLIYNELGAVIDQLVDIKAISSDSTATTGDVVLANTAGGDVTVDLQEASNAKITVKKTTADGNDVIVTANGTMDGAAQIILDTQYQSVTLVCDGTNWYVI